MHKLSSLPSEDYKRVLKPVLDLILNGKESKE